ncbi:hypothetical protein Tco_0245469 [Tanacetum coccineum]
MKVEESLNMTFDEIPPPTKLSPLVDDDVGEQEAIKRKVKVQLCPVTEPVRLPFQALLSILGLASFVDQDDLSVVPGLLIWTVSWASQPRPRHCVIDIFDHTSASLRGAFMLA